MTTTISDISKDELIEETIEVEDDKCKHILQKLDIINFNNGWNDNNEKIIISIGENCASYKWMHDKCAIYYKIINNIINILSILFTSFLTAETFVIENNNDLSLTVIRRVITYSLSVISLLQNFLNSEMLSIKHINASNEFSKLYHDIQQQMCRFRRERKNATKYVSYCLKCYDSLVMNNPDINNFVLYKFKKIFTNFNIPSVEDRFNRIEIITEQSFNNENNNNTNNVNNVNNTNNANNVNNANNNTYMTTLNDNMIKNVTNNLSDIHQMYKINGDISDNDLEKIDSLELKRLNEHKIRYEYNRFLQHSDEND
jgi:hypothetical protein